MRGIRACGAYRFSHSKTEFSPFALNCVRSSRVVACLFLPPAFLVTSGLEMCGGFALPGTKVTCSILVHLLKGI